MNGCTCCCRLFEPVYSVRRVTAQVVACGGTRSAAETQTEGFPPPCSSRIYRSSIIAAAAACGKSTLPVNFVAPSLLIDRCACCAVFCVLLFLLVLRVCMGLGWAGLGINNTSSPGHRSLRHSSRSCGAGGPPHLERRKRPRTKERGSGRRNGWTLADC